MASAVVEDLACGMVSMGSIPTKVQFCKNLEICVSGTRVTVFESCKAPAGDFRLGRKTQQVGGKLEQVSCKLESVSCILKLYKACLCISINIITPVETHRQRTRSGARGIG